MPKSVTVLATRTSRMVHERTPSNRVLRHHSRAPSRRRNVVTTPHRTLSKTTDDGVLKIHQLKYGVEYKVVQALAGAGTTLGYLILVCHNHNQWRGRCVLEINPGDDVVRWNHPLRHDDIIHRVRPGLAEGKPYKITARAALSV